MSVDETHRENSLSISVSENDSSEKSITPDDASANDVSMQTESAPSNAFNPPVLRQPPARDLKSPAQSADVPKTSNDIIYDGGLEDKDDVEFKVVFADLHNTEMMEPDGNEVEIEVRGVKYKIPYAIECHLCNEMMNLCLRRTRYRGQSREYPAYRCNRKGCQTFRSIRKVFHNCIPSISDIGKMQAPPLDSPKISSKRTTSGEFSEEDDEEFVVQRVYIPKVDTRNPDQKPLSVSDRMRKANQVRATVFSEFSDQLRRDIAANKRVRIRKQAPEEEEQQGTLFYISKELSPQEIIELQDAIIKTLISLRKIPPPMTMHDLPLFANCPYSKNVLEAGLAKSQNEFWNAFTSSAQPPIPVGFTRRKDDTLIYRDPKPYEVPVILQENSPRKQADAVVNYHRRKEEQDARRMERRHVEKKYRSWASLKREFDMAETEDRPESKLSKTNSDDAPVSISSQSDRHSRQVTLRELMHKIDGNSTGKMSCRIRANDSEGKSESMRWIDMKTPTKESPEEMANDGYNQQDPDNELEDDVFESASKFKESSSMQTLSASNSLRSPTSPLMKTFSPLTNRSMKNPASSHSQMFFPDSHFMSNSINNHSPAFYAFLPSYTMPSLDSSLHYQNRDLVDEHYQCIGASEVVRTDSTPYTYIHPVSGMRLTDPSAYLNSFIPSPITKLAPMSFNDETSRPRRSSEPTTPSLYNLDDFNGSDEKAISSEESKKMMNSFKFDPPL
ncbi:hypothetical protein GCK72_006193 [Caenorhabditis remanei]|uniref:Uncharacterized protein n=1 Tax=Caenorhabditis remanei TaxID=31234 RepID=A0A6A5HHQ4_CAERE|nr:hypothetical protein GCK72_006193 [Caenorhabditis remanei]KAF1766237.1 hypothetical protein GCK72_006193 [Caenorhabditis remanei]